MNRKKNIERKKMGEDDKTFAECFRTNTISPRGDIREDGTPISQRNRARFARKYRQDGIAIRRESRINYDRQTRTLNSCGSLQDLSRALESVVPIL